MTGNKYRIGQDRKILWTITNNDSSPFDLNGKEVRLFITHDRGQEEVEVKLPEQENGIKNIVEWDFFGSDQRILGSYTLTLLIETEDGKRVIRKDVCDAFTLVGRDCQESVGEGMAHIDGNVITLASQLDVYTILPVVPTIGGNGNWFVEGKDTGKPSFVNVPIVTISPVPDADATIEGFEEYGLANYVGSPILCLFKKNSKDPFYQMANLSIELGNQQDEYRLSFVIVSGGAYQYNKYLPDCIVSEGWTYSYLYNAKYKFVTPLGEGRLRFAEENFSEDSILPIANSSVTKKFQDVDKRLQKGNFVKVLYWKEDDSLQIEENESLRDISYEEMEEIMKSNCPILICVKDEELGTHSVSPASVVTVSLNGDSYNGIQWDYNGMRYCTGISTFADPDLTKEVSPTVDWNANAQEPGYIANKPFMSSVGDTNVYSFDVSLATFLGEVGKLQNARKRADIILRVDGVYAGHGDIDLKRPHHTLEIDGGANTYEIVCEADGTLGMYCSNYTEYQSVHVTVQYYLYTELNYNYESNLEYLRYQDAGGTLSLKDYLSMKRIDIDRPVLHDIDFSFQRPSTANDTPGSWIGRITPEQYRQLELGLVGSNVTLMDEPLKASHIHIGYWGQGDIAPDHSFTGGKGLRINQGAEDIYLFENGEVAIEY